MKKIKLTIVLLLGLAICSCGTRLHGSATDTTGTNGATNGNGKVPTTGVHDYQTK